HALVAHGLTELLLHHGEDLGERGGHQSSLLRNFLVVPAMIAMLRSVSPTRFGQSSKKPRPWSSVPRSTSIRYRAGTTLAMARSGSGMLSIGKRNPERRS